MPILSKEALLTAIDTGAIVVNPFQRECVGPGSIDLRLGNVFRVFRKQKTPIDIQTTTDYADFTDRVVLQEGETFTLDPGMSALGITMEKVTLGDHLCAWLEGRSRFARLGLMVHISAGFLHPGISNQQVLEMSNFSPNPLRLHPGTPVCQIVIQEVKGRSQYSGKFVAQEGF